MALAITAGLALAVSYGLWLAVHRLYLSPLAKFPGPKLAALTQWYEVYFDMVHKGGGQFPFEIRRMHERYGPIVRINPFELHVDDADFYDVVYATNKPLDKMTHFQYRFNVPLATFSTADAAEHRVRRAAINPFFSIGRIRERNGQIQALMDGISRRLSTEFAGTGTVVSVADMWSCYTTDAIMDVVFARPKRLYTYPGFKSPLTVALKQMAEWAHVTLHFGWLLTIMNCLPNGLVKRLFPPFRPIVEFREEMDAQIDDILTDRNLEAKQSATPTLFHDILNSKLPGHELRRARLNDEAVGLVGAGTETTAHTLTIGTFHILDNPAVHARLRAELEAAVPDPAAMASWAELERLPYLTAVVKEVLRIAYGGVERLPRVNRAEAWEYNGWTIPPGTPVGMDTYHMHTNADHFPDPLRFDPDRWLGSPKDAGGRRPLTYHLVTFARGSRMCVGLNLAYAEIYIGIATLFRRHTLELFETTRRDVDFYKEELKASPWPGSKGVRVLVR